MNMEAIRKNKLGSILQFSIPSIIAMLLSTVITITDGYFTGNFVGEDALAAINLGLPVLYLFLGLGLCVGVGGSVISGRLLGAKEEKKAGQVFSQTILTSILVSIVTSVLVFLFFSPILHLLKADGTLGVFYREYYTVMLVNYPLLVLGTVLGMFIRTDGKPQFCMIISLLSCVINGVFDYVFVAKLSMGVRGSAIASLMVQVCVVVLSLLYFMKGTRSIRFSKFHFDKAVHKEILFNGSSELIGEMASAIAMFVFNFVLMKYVGKEGVAAFTVLGFTVYGYSMITIGFGQGISPLVSICYGAKEMKLADGIRKTTNYILFAVGAVVAITFLLFGKQYAGAFGCSEQVVKMVTDGFMLFAVTFLLMGYDVINSMYFTSCGDAKSSAIISFLRGIVLLLIFSFVFPTLWGMTGVWMVTPTTEALTALVSMRLIYKKNERCEEQRGRKKEWSREPKEQFE